MQAFKQHRVYFLCKKQIPIHETGLKNRNNNINGNKEDAAQSDPLLISIENELT